MAEITKITHDADPLRCQAIFHGGQCPHQHGPNSVYCPIHGGNKADDKVAAESIRNFRFTKWAARIQGYADSPVVKSLREEIGILRMVLEETIQRCETETDLVLQSQHISDLVMKVEKVVASCQALETKTGSVLDKTLLTRVAEEWITQITEVIPPEKLDSVSNSLIEVINRISSKSEEATKVG
ncbi:MAG: hypothetical protein M0R80_13475 [Proteobacteria bacterium]|jgi:hypothetical protein|nr:hypothetical protein [Pseudomonadota bacterium]